MKQNHVCPQRKKIIVFIYVEGKVAKITYKTTIINAAHKYK